MNTDLPGGYDYGQADAARRKAWVAHYIAKGCTDTKAERVASEKMRRKRTWP